MPFANVATGGFTNSAGIFTAPAHELDPQRPVRPDHRHLRRHLAGRRRGGNLTFGTSTGTDCTTPGYGGAGNTHSARTQFYQVNRIKEVGRGWLPSNTWLQPASSPSTST